jgi:hypothetical protein
VNIIFTYKIAIFTKSITLHHQSDFHHLDSFSRSRLRDRVSPWTMWFMSDIVSIYDLYATYTVFIIFIINIIYSIMVMVISINLDYRNEIV